jgi:hypothetical protein
MTDIAAGTATYNPIKYVNKVFTDINSDNNANWVITEKASTKSYCDGASTIAATISTVLAAQIMF